MKISIPVLFIAPIIILFLFTGCERAEEDILQLMPENTEVIFENDYVRVLNITLEPGEAQPLHRCGHRIIYALGDYTINYYQPDDTTEISWNEGGIHWHQEGYHAVENIGESIVEYLLIERKAATLPDAEDIVPEPDPVFSEAEFVMEVFENDHARISRITLPVGESLPEHEGPNRLIYSQSEYRIRYTSDDEETIEREYEYGDLHWHSADVHTVENIGETDAEFIVIGFLQ